MAISKTKAVKTRRSAAPRKMTLSCQRYIYKVLKQVHPDVGLSRKAVVVLEGMVNSLWDQILDEAASLVQSRGAQTLTARDVITAAALVLGQKEVAKHAASEANKACIKWVAAKQ